MYDKTAVLLYPGAPHTALDGGGDLIRTHTARVLYNRTRFSFHVHRPHPTVVPFPRPRFIVFNGWFVFPPLLTGYRVRVFARGKAPKIYITVGI